MENVNGFCSELLAKIMETTKILNRLGGPQSNDILYYQTVYPEVKHSLDSISKKMMSSSQAIRTCEKGGDARYSPNSSPSLLFGSYGQVVNALDDIFEDIDTRLDIYYGRRVLPDKETLHATKLAESLPRKKKCLEHAPKSATILKPKDSTIFTPALHPYEQTIRDLGEQYSATILSRVDSPSFSPPGPPEWIDTEQDLIKVANHLQTQPMIAVDLENHSYHSYYGHTCLMQISSRTRDFLIDTILLKQQIRTILAPVFANPAILKVFHGAESDIQWLQRDFEIFVVSMFDTYFAAKSLGLARHSLAFLLESFVDGIVVDKQYQLADWRIRPLPAPMIHYAQQDTHYLLYIFDRLKNALLDSPTKELALLGVLKQSASRCKILYKPDTPGPNAWKSILSKSTISLSPDEIKRIQALYDWRNMVAKIEDESLHAVMPNYVVLKLIHTSKDPCNLLQSLRIDTSVALKHGDSLCEAMQLNKRDEKRNSTEPKTNATKAIKPTHIRFEDDSLLLDHKPNLPSILPPLPHPPVEDPIPPSIVPLFTKRRKIEFATDTSQKSLVNFFNPKTSLEQSINSNLSMKSIVAELAFTKIQKAAEAITVLAQNSSLAVSSDTNDRVVEEGPVQALSNEQANPIESVQINHEAMVLSTGERIAASTLLSSFDDLKASGNTVDLSIKKGNRELKRKLGSESTTLPQAQPFDYSQMRSKIIENRGVADEGTNAKPGEYKPYAHIDEVSFASEANKKGANKKNMAKSDRISVNPRSGNKLAVFSSANKK